MKAKLLIRTLDGGYPVFLEAIVTEEGELTPTEPQQIVRVGKFLGSDFHRLVTGLQLKPETFRRYFELALEEADKNGIAYVYAKTPVSHYKDNYHGSFVLEGIINMFGHLKEE